MTINNPNKEMQCVALDENGGQCGEPGRPNRLTGLNIATCDEHRLEAYSYKEMTAQNTYHFLERAGVISGHTPGWTYVVRLNDGSIKLGMVGSDSTKSFDMQSR